MARAMHGDPSRKRQAFNPVSTDPLLGAARADGDGVDASVVHPVAPLTPDAVPALVAEMVHAVGAAAAKAEPAVVTTSTPPDGAVQVTVTSTCPLAALPLGMRFACPWERGRTAENVQVYRCAHCGAERRR